MGKKQRDSRDQEEQLIDGITGYETVHSIRTRLVGLKQAECYHVNKGITEVILFGIHR